MKPIYTFARAMVASFELDGLAVQGLHALVKPPTLLRRRNKLSDRDAYMKDFVSAAMKSFHGAPASFGQRRRPCQEDRKTIEK
jgi:hypothetical protein